MILRIKSLRPIPIWAYAVPFALSALLPLWRGWGSRSERPYVVIQAADRLPVRQGQQALVRYRFTPGERLVYNLDYANLSVIDFNRLYQDSGQAVAHAAGAPTTHLSARLTGEMDVTILQKEEAGYAVAYHFPDPTVQVAVNGNAGEDLGRLLQREMRRDIVATFSPEGNVLGVRFEQAMDPRAQRLARALLALTQVVLPSAGRPAAQWETQENDPIGRAAVHYQEEALGGRDVANPALRQFRKSIVSYPEARASEGDTIGTVTRVEPAGSLLVRFDTGQGRLDALAGQEAQATYLGEAPIAQAQTHVSLNYVRTELVTSADLRALRQQLTDGARLGKALPLSARPSREERETDLARTDLGRTTPESLLAELAQADAIRRPDFDTNPLYLKVKALVFLQSGECVRLGKVLATADPHGVRMQVIVRALSAVGHAQAQAALMAAIRSRAHDAPALSLLIPALSMTAAPIPQAEETLRALVLKPAQPRSASLALLGLGAMAHNLARREPARAARLAVWIARRGEMDSTLENTRLVLAALGNAGASSVFPLLERTLHAKSPDLRGRAATALRFLPGGQVDSLLAQTLTTDSEADVRARAAFALGFRSLTDATYQAQVRALRADASGAVRQQVVSNLWEARRQKPEIRKWIEEARTRDADENIRKLAAGLLSQAF